MMTIILYENNILEKLYCIIRYSKKAGVYPRAPRWTPYPIIVLFAMQFVNLYVKMGTDVYRNKKSICLSLMVP